MLLYRHMFMKPSEISKLSYNEFDKPFQIEGELIVSGGLTHIIDIDAYTSNKPHYGILLKFDLLKDLLGKDLPVAAGTRVNYSGKIRVKATLTYTGYSILPASIEYIYNYSFENEHGSFDFYISDTYKDVLLKTPKKISAPMLSSLRSVCSKFSSMTVMELKKFLVNNHEIIIAEHIEGADFENLIRVLDEFELQYKVSECPIRFGMP